MKFYVVLPPSCAGDLKTPKFVLADVEDPVEGLVRFAYCPYVGLHVPGAVRVLLKGVSVAGVVSLDVEGVFEVVGPLNDVIKLRSARVVKLKGGRVYVGGYLGRLDRERFSKGLGVNFRLGYFFI